VEADAGRAAEELSQLLLALTYLVVRNLFLLLFELATSGSGVERSRLSSKSILESHKIRAGETKQA
jgi:hypothetical protein